MEQLLDVKNKLKFYVHSYVVHLISRIFSFALSKHIILLLLELLCRKTDTFDWH